MGPIERKVRYLLMIVLFLLMAGLVVSMGGWLTKVGFGGLEAGGLTVLALGVLGVYFLVSRERLFNH